MKEKLRTKIDTWKPFLLKGILCEDNNGLRYLIIAGQQKESIDKKDYEDSISAIKGRIECDKEFAAKVAEMLKRYKITDIFFGDIDVIEKRVWDAQTSLYAEKKKMTNTELLRARLTGEWSKKKEENK